MSNCWKTNEIQHPSAGHASASILQLQVKLAMLCVKALLKCYVSRHCKVLPSALQKCFYFWFCKSSTITSLCVWEPPRAPSAAEVQCVNALHKCYPVHCRSAFLFSTPVLQNRLVLSFNSVHDCPTVGIASIHVQLLED